MGRDKNRDFICQLLLSYDAATVIYLRHSRPVHAAPTTHLQLADGSLKDDMVSPFLAVSPVRPAVQAAEERTAAPWWGPARRCRGPAPGLGWSPGFLAALQAFACGMQQVPCTPYPVQLPSLTETASFSAM